MILALKSNGKQIRMSKEDFDLFSADQKRSYHIIDKNDEEKKVEKVVKRDPPPTGEKK